MIGAWTKADAWYRRDVSPESYLTVCRCTNGHWHWRQTERRTGAVLAEGPGISATSAMGLADDAVAVPDLIGEAA